MKKLFFVSLVLAMGVLFTGASVWEGAAAVSGDFPEEGLYVATNAFPRNTVVDLTNLETGKTVRVIVSAGLDTPGLLALVSREAAVAVGLQSRTIGRIRMIQPSDPIAFSRFTEDHLRSGDPDYDPLAAVEGAYPGALPPAGQPAEAAGTGNTEAVITEAGNTKAGGPEDAGDSTPEAALPALNPPALDPVIGAFPSDPAAARTPEEAPAEPAGSFREQEKDPESAWAGAPVEGPVPAISPVEDPVDTTDALIALGGPGKDPVLSDIPRETIPGTEPRNEPSPISVSGPVLIPVPVPVPVPVPQAASGDTPEPAPSVPPETETAGASPEYSYTLVPAEERVPRSYDEAGSVPQVFSVPAVSDLERGKYYLQIGAYSQIGAVEQELARVDKNYPLAVQCTGVPGKPVYRILVGPVNQGESGALLRNFQSRGYRDAFVRRGN
ncbi:MAG: SPOR domain-containing protein [Spirochaetaceae bacterium]|jgi:hypothetical protein|nr:SPOR domain-containing protein [Spirochaetaceae bacterium]